MFTQTNIGDTIAGMTVTRTSEKTCWLDNRPFRWSTIENLIAGGSPRQTKYNLDIEVDWKDKEKVLQYYNSFVSWGFYVSMGDGREGKHVFEVKDGLVFFGETYWLPAPKSTHSAPNEKNIIEDGWYTGYLIKKPNNWFGNASSSSYASQIFAIESKYNKFPTIEDIKKLKPNCTELYAYPYQGEIRVEYSQSGRSGLQINDISVDLKSFFTKTYLQDRWNKNTLVELSDKQWYKLLYEGDMLETRLNAILNSSSYRIDDDESYGEYRLNYLVIDKKDCDKFFAEIEEKLKSL